MENLEEEIDLEISAPQFVLPWDLNFPWLQIWALQEICRTFQCGDFAVYRKVTISLWIFEHF